MSLGRISHFWLDTGVKIRLLLWGVLSLALSLALFRDFWVSLPVMLNPVNIFGEYNVSPWGVLALCLFFLWLKRKEVARGMQKGKLGKEGLKRLVVSFLIGAVIVLGAVLIPFSKDFLTFQVLMAWLGAYIMVCGWWTARIPTILLAIYGFVIFFPSAIAGVAGDAYTQTVLNPLNSVVGLLGYPWQTEGHWISLVSRDGDQIRAAVTVACAGPTTMAVFIALFALMTLDMPLSPKKAVGIFMLGLAGTWLQSLVRLVILVVTGYYLGEDAFWGAHYWTIYILFPLWYLLFVYVYFRVAGRVGVLRQSSFNEGKLTTPSTVSPGEGDIN